MNNGLNKKLNNHETLSTSEGSESPVITMNLINTSNTQSMVDTNSANKKNFCSQINNNRAASRSATTRGRETTCQRAPSSARNLRRMADVPYTLTMTTNKNSAFKRTDSGVSQHNSQEAINKNSTFKRTDSGVSQHNSQEAINRRPSIFTKRNSLSVSRRKSLLEGKEATADKTYTTNSKQQIIQSAQSSSCSRTTVRASTKLLQSIPCISKMTEVKENDIHAPKKEDLRPFPIASNLSEEQLEKLALIISAKLAPLIVRQLLPMIVRQLEPTMAIQPRDSLQQQISTDTPHQTPRLQLIAHEVSSLDSEFSSNTNGHQCDHLNMMTDDSNLAPRHT